MNTIVPVTNCTQQTYECRICLEIDKLINLIKPCKCKGYLSYFHQQCLKKWIYVAFKMDQSSQCEICGHKFSIKIDNKYKCSLNKTKSIKLLLFLAILIFIDALFWGFSIFLMIIDQWNPIYRLIIIILLIILACAICFPIFHIFAQSFIEVIQEQTIESFSQNILNNDGICDLKNQSSLMPALSREQLQTVTIYVRPRRDITFAF